MTHCSVCSDGTTCDYCAEGYWSDPANGNTCQTCWAHCTSCLDFGIGYYCLQCADGYAPSSNQSCEVIPAHATGWYFTSVIQGNTIVVTECEVGWTPNTNQNGCIQCPAHCDYCSNANSCDNGGCSDGYYLNLANVCQSCSAKHSGCEFCYDETDDGVYCYSCGTGKGFVNGPQVCASCSGDCEECMAYYYNPKQHCMSCQNGWYMIPDNTCVQRNPPTGSASGLAPSLAVVLLLALLSLVR